MAVNGEVLESDSTRLAEKTFAAGVDVELHMFDDSVHVFPVFPFLPEASTALDLARSFADRVTGRTVHRLTPRSERAVHHHGA